MKKNIILLSVLVLILILISMSFQEKKVEDISSDIDTSYLVEDMLVTLKGGFSEIQIPQSSQKISTRYFGNDLHLDINKDGKEDSVFFITQERGGSGVFFYIVAHLSTPYGYTGSRAYFIGDRIAPQSIDLDDDGTIIVNYADRGERESFATQPSIGKSIWLSFNSSTGEFSSVKK